MIGVTIGIGSEWERVARRAANRMSELTGLDCHVINSWHGYIFEHPSWMKCKILDLFPEENEFLYFDADIWCMKSWNPKKLFDESGGEFMAVLEPPHNAIDEECKKYRLFRNHYFNGGLLIFGRHHAEVFEDTLKAHPFGRWYEQTPLNACAFRSAKHILIDSKYNFLNHGGSMPLDSCDAINVHWCSMNSAEKIEQLQVL